jgi:putative nucleotidyltransferase with HDIG domain
MTVFDPSLISLPRFVRAAPRVGRFSAGWVLFGVFLVCYVAAIAYAGVTGNRELSEILLDFIVLPVAVGSFRYGLRGPFLAGALAVGLWGLSFSLGGLINVEIFALHAIATMAAVGIVAWSVAAMRSQSRSLNETLEVAVRERTRELEQRTVELAQTAAELDAAHREDIHRLALAGEFRDDQTAEHTERVGKLAARLAGELGLDEDTIAVIREAAPLHDVGKIGTPDGILLKPGRLTDPERTQMQRHAELGAKLLSGSRFPTMQMAEQIALSHHERWDGTGYPHRLAGEQTPLAARIVALADVFDALTHARPYKEASSAADATREIEQDSGHHFDPKIVDALLRVQASDRKHVSYLSGSTRPRPQPRPSDLPGIRRARLRSLLPHT